LEDLLIIGEQVLGVPVEDLIKVIDIALADSALASPAASFGGHEFYPDPIVKAAVLGSHLTKNHAMPDGNKRLAYVSMTVFLQVDGHAWTEPDPADVDVMIRTVTAGNLDDDVMMGEFAAWIRKHATRSTPPHPPSAGRSPVPAP
jgi:death-on-curing protein